MPKGLWVWPEDQKGQRRTLRKVSDSPHLMTALTALAKSKDGLSNSELGEAVEGGSEWPTLWVIRQLTSLGFVDFKVDFFGNPARYQLTEQGRAALAAITGQPLAKPPAVPAAQASAPKPATPPSPPPSAPQPAAPKAV
jgi:hypothetical protein